MAAAATSEGYVTYRTKFQYFFDYNSPWPSGGLFLKLLRECRALCSRHGIRVLHANSAAPTQWLVPAAYRENIPVLTHLHIDYLRRTRYVTLLHAANLVVGVSQYVMEGLEADGFSAERMLVIHNGIDPSRLDCSTTNLRTALDIPADAFVIASVGSLIKRKGHDILIRAFNGLSQARQQPHLLILGDGPEQDALRKLALSLSVDDRVHFLGQSSDVSSAFQAADVFALASRREAFGLVFAEAGYFSLPTVSTRVGGIPEVVSHENTGLLVAPEDATAFSGALARLMDDGGFRARLGSAASMRVKTMFTAERMARQFEETYTRLATIPSERRNWENVKFRLRPYLRLSNSLRREGRDKA